MSSKYEAVPWRAEALMSDLGYAVIAALTTIVLVATGVIAASWIVKSIPQLAPA